MPRRRWYRLSSPSVRVYSLLQIGDVIGYRSDVIVGQVQDGQGDDLQQSVRKDVEVVARQSKNLQAGESREGHQCDLLQLIVSRQQFFHICGLQNDLGNCLQAGISNVHPFATGRLRGGLEADVLGGDL